MGSTAKRLNGTVTSWNDERGFGFISTEAGAEQTFVHIKAFPPGSARPQLGTRLTFEVERTADGKSRAIRAQPVGQMPPVAQPHSQEPRQPPQRAEASSSRHRTPQRGKSRRISGVADYLAIVVFVAGYLAVNTLWPLPLWVAGLYLGASVVSFIVYAVDKSAATNGRWRVSENTLLALGVVGGWPGAIIAQQTLRHKTKKASFRVGFWVTVVLNLVVFTVFATPLFAAVVERSAHPLF